MLTGFGRFITGFTVGGGHRRHGMAVGSEAYQAALVFYKSVKMAAQDIPGAKAVYEELKTRFPGGKRKTGETEMETVTETIRKEVKIDYRFFELQTPIFGL
jgi:hypothetical protein